MNTETFERARLQLFQRHGFEAQSRWVEHALGEWTYVLARGAGACPTILVHGGLAEASVWCPMAGRLAGPVLIPDRPGHGLSSTVDYRGADFRRAAADWLAGVMDGLGVDRADLVGNSMGGYFSIVFALAYPSRVRRLVLVGAPAGLDRDIPLFLRLWGAPIVGRFISALAARNAAPEDLRRRVMADLCAHPERLSVEALRVAADAGSKPGWHRAVRSMLAAVSTLRGFRAHLLLRDAMTGLRTPTLFLWGDRDSFAPPTSGEEVAARMPFARLETIPDAGHLAQLDQPEIVAARIARWINADSSDAR